MAGADRVRTGASKENAAWTDPVTEVTIAATTMADPVPAPLVHCADVVEVHDDDMHDVRPRRMETDTSVAPKFSPESTTLPNPVVAVFGTELEVPTGAS